MSRAATIAVPTTRFDVAGEATSADPWALLADLRGRGPVLWHETLERWIVTREREVRTVLADYTRFTLEGTSSQELFGREAFISIDDKPRHDALRGVWAEPFRLPALERLRPTVRRIAETLVAPVAERVVAGEAVDLVETFCRPLPTLVIALMMGVPQEMTAQVVAWSDQMAAGGPSYRDDAAMRQATLRAKTGLADYLGELIRERRRKPGEDLISKLAASDVARDLSDEALVQNARQLLFAGNETTAKWLAHIFLVYGRDPAVQDAIRADRALTRAANDEVMRWQGVTGTVARRVTGGPVELAGVTLRPGDLVTCLLMAANRDPARYDDPESFDIHRRPEPNLGFGVGMHNCLGINLAKLEAEVAVDALLDHLPPYRIAAPPAYSTLTLRGPYPVTIARRPD
jgi:cytochrome P450